MVTRPPRTERIVAELTRRLAEVQRRDCQLIVRVKVRNGVPFKVIWSSEDEEDLTTD